MVCYLDPPPFRTQVLTLFTNGSAAVEGSFTELFTRHCWLKKGLHAQSVPLPRGWAESKTGQGEVQRLASLFLQGTPKGHLSSEFPDVC